MHLAFSSVFTTDFLDVGGVPGVRVCSSTLFSGPSFCGAPKSHPSEQSQRCPRMLKAMAMSEAAAGILTKT